MRTEQAALTACMAEPLGGWGSMSSWDGVCPKLRIWASTAWKRHGQVWGLRGANYRQKNHKCHLEMSALTSGLFHTGNHPCFHSGAEHLAGQWGWGRSAGPGQLCLLNPAGLSHLAPWWETETSSYKQKLSFLASSLFSCIFSPCLHHPCWLKANLLQVQRKPSTALILGPISPWEVEERNTAPVKIAWCSFAMGRALLLTVSLNLGGWTAK